MTLIPVSDCGVLGGRDVQISHPSSALPLGADQVMKGLVRALDWHAGRRDPSESHQDRVLDVVVEKMIKSGDLD